MSKTQDILESYMAMTKERIDNGFRPYIITFMFNPLKGEEDAIRLKMNESVTKTYSHLLTRVLKRVGRDVNKLPLWVFCQDWPVPKDSKTKKPDVTINNGCHVHAFALLPPNANSKFDLVQYIEDNQKTLISLDGKNSVMRVHAVEVTETPEVAAAYVIKSLDRNRIDADGIECLPLVRSEMTTLSNAERRDRAANLNMVKNVPLAENDNAPNVQLRESQIKLMQLRNRLRDK